MIQAGLSVRHDEIEFDLNTHAWRQEEYGVSDPDPFAEGIDGWRRSLYESGVRIAIIQLAEAERLPPPSPEEREKILSQVDALTVVWREALAGTIRGKASDVAVDVLGRKLWSMFEGQVGLTWVGFNRPLTTDEVEQVSREMVERLEPWRKNPVVVDEADVMRQFDPDDDVFVRPVDDGSEFFGRQTEAVREFWSATGDQVGRVVDAMINPEWYAAYADERRVVSERRKALDEVAVAGALAWEAKRRREEADRAARKRPAPASVETASGGAPGAGSPAASAGKDAGQGGSGGWLEPAALVLLVLAVAIGLGVAIRQRRLLG
jgi:hypothetical protein